MKRLCVAIILTAVVLSSAMASGFSFKSVGASAGISIDTNGVVRYTLEGVVFPNREALNVGSRMELRADRKALIYPVFIRFRAGALFVEAGGGYDLEDRQFAAFAMPGVSMGSETVSFSLGIPLAYRSNGFSVGIEALISVN